MTTRPWSTAPLWAGSFDLLSLMRGGTVIFGIKRTGTFILPFDENGAGIRGPMGALIAATGLASAGGRTPRHRRPPHHPLDPTAENRPVKPRPPDVRDVTTTCHHGRYTITMDTTPSPSSPTEDPRDRRPGRGGR